MNGELLTAEQAAEQLQLHADTVRRLLREGEIPGRKVGKRQWRISAAVLKEYIEKEPVEWAVKQRPPKTVKRPVK
jgi:excisionase family DNA binding protein